jgi:hypothetical protein
VAVAEVTLTQRDRADFRVAVVLAASALKLFILTLMPLSLSVRVEQFQTMEFGELEVLAVSDSLLWRAAAVAATLEHRVVVAPVRLVAAACIRLRVVQAMV